MDDYARLTAPDTVRLERLLPTDVEDAWTWLTDSDKRGRWLAKGPMELRVGGAVRLDFLHAELTPHREAVPERFKGVENGHQLNGRILECDPPHRLSFTWGDTREVPSEVTFELTPEGAGTRLSITHRRLPADQLVNVSGGWHVHVAVLAAKLAHQTPPLFWATLTDAEAEYRRRYAAGPQ